MDQDHSNSPQPNVRHLHAVANALPCMMFEADAQGGNVWSNDAWVRYTGLTRAELAGHGWQRVLHPQDREQGHADWLRAVESAGEYRVRQRLRRFDGQWRWNLVNAAPIRNAAGGIDGWAGTITDIDDIVRGEASLLEQARHARFRLQLEEQLRGITEAQAMMDAATAALGAYLGVAQVGYGEIEERLGQAHITVHRDWNDGRIPSVEGTWRLDDFGSAYLRDIEAGRTAAIMDVTRDARTAAPEVVAAYAAIHTRSFLDVPLVKYGRLVALLFIHHPEPRSWTSEEVALVEQTCERLWTAVERARAERALAASQAHLAALYAQTGAGLYEMDRDGRIVEANQCFCDIVGRTREALLGQRMLDITHPDERDANRQLFERLVASGEPFSIEKRYMRPDGGVMWVTSTLRLIRSPSTPPRLFAVSIDVTPRRQLQERLQQLQELQRLGAEAGHTGTWSLNLVTDECTISPMMARLMGHAGELSRVPSQQWRGSIVAEDRAGYQVAIAAALEGTGVFEHELRIRWPDGTVRWLHSRGEVVRDAAGQPLWLHGASVDVTRRRLAEDELRSAQAHLRARHALLTAVLASTDNLVFVKDREGRYLLMNEAGARLHGQPAAEFIGRTDAEIHTPNFAAVLRHNDLRVLHTGETLRVEESGEFAGRRRTYFSTKTPLRDEDGYIMGVVGMAVDITEHKAAAAGLAELNATLEQRVQERTAELAAARDAAETASRAKSAFLANMSHEIRTPMNAILGLAHLLGQEDATPRQAAQLRKIGDAARHLLSVLNDVLDLSKIDAGKLQLQEHDFELFSLLEQVRSIVSEGAAAKGLRLEVDPGTVPQRLHGDETRVRQALLNYASNAVKFTQAGHVVLRARLLEEHGERLLVRFEVEDSGMGVDPQQLPRLFEAFEQADASTTRQHGGTGLGLAITRRLAQLMGGDTGAQDLSGDGSVFWFTAWLSRAEQTGTAEAAPPATEAAHGELRRRHAGARVLVAEDNAVNREVALALLRAAGLAVDFAEDGAVAVEKTRQGHYALVLMDMHMPAMDGLQATRALRATPGLQALPILAMTANAFDEDRAACLAAGMNDFVTKPVEPQSLYATLLRWLDHKNGEVDAGATMPLGLEPRTGTA